MRGGVIINQLIGIIQMGVFKKFQSPIPETERVRRCFYLLFLRFGDFLFLDPYINEFDATILIYTFINLKIIN